jgi:hypothetical protein
LPLRLKRRQAEGRREKLLFLLFCILSILIHGVVLVAFAGNMKFHRMSADNSKTQEAIQVETLSLPPPSAEPPSPPPSQTIPPAPASRKPPEPDQLVRKPKATPTPSARPTPALAATPKPSPSAGMPTPVPSPSPSNPSDLTPTPTPVPTQLADLPEKEVKFKKAMQDFFKAQDMDVPDELPHGFKSWEEYEKFLTDGEGFEKKALDLMKLPENTQGSEQSGSSPSSPNPESTPESGTTDASGEARKGFNPGGWFDFGRNSSNNVDAHDNFETEVERRLREANLGKFNTSLETDAPASPALPAPENVQTGELGFSYVKFIHDGMQFNARWDSAVQPELRQVDVNFYPPADPKLIKSFSLKWQPNWDKDIKVNLIPVIQLTYERQKEAQP